MNSNEKMVDCWVSAHKLIEVGRKRDAVLVCSAEPCATISVECQNYLGWLYYDSGNLEESLEWFERSLSKGSAEALYGVASINFLKKNFVSAFNGFKMAGKKKYFRACYWLGFMCERGLGVEKNIDMALSYYECGAENGYLVAERAIIDIIFRTGTLLDKVLVLPRLVVLVMRSLPIAYRNIDDERITDIPNIFNPRKNLEGKK